MEHLISIAGTSLSSHFRVPEEMLAMSAVEEERHIRCYSSRLILVEHRAALHQSSDPHFTVRRDLPILETDRTLNITPLQRRVRLEILRLPRLLPMRRTPYQQRISSCLRESD